MGSQKDRKQIENGQKKNKKRKANVQKEERDRKLIEKGLDRKRIGNRYQTDRKRKANGKKLFSIRMIMLFYPFSDLLISSCPYLSF